MISYEQWRGQWAALLEVSSRGTITANISCYYCGKRLENTREVMITSNNLRTIHIWCQTDEDY